MKKRNCIISDCVCDLSDEFVQENDIELIRFYLNVNGKQFMDGYEISLVNVIEHYSNVETKIVSNPPSAEEFCRKYTKLLENYEEVIHFTISSKISGCYDSASEGRQLLGALAEKVHIIDTLSLSNGMALLLVKAVEMNNQGMSASTIVDKMFEMIPKINVRFVTPSADYLAINERVTQRASNVFKFFKVRPVFGMSDGYLVIEGVELGRREGYLKRHVKHRLKKLSRIDTEHIFIVHAGCTKDEINTIVNEVKNKCNAKNIYVNKTSATVACNCGKGTYGIIYLDK